MNKRVFIKVSLLLASVLPFVSFASNDNDLLARINAGKTITIGTEGTYPPFTYHDDNGALTGYDVEVARLVGEKLGVSVEFKETQWDAMLAGLKAGRFDLVANQVSLTSPERRATFDKSSPYSYSGAVIVARKDDNSIKQPSDLKGKKAAQTLSSNYGERAKAAGAEIVPVDGMAQALLIIEQGRADTTMNASLAILDYFKKNPNSKLEIKWHAPSEEWLGAGLTANKGNDAALAKISEAIDALRAEGKLAELGEKFFGQDVSAIK